MPTECELFLNRAWMDSLEMIGSILMSVSGVSVLVILLCAAVHLVEERLSRRSRVPAASRRPRARPVSQRGGRQASPARPFGAVYGAPLSPLRRSAERRERGAGRV